MKPGHCRSLRGSAGAAAALRTAPALVVRPSEFQDLRGVAEALAPRGHERCLVVVAEVARRHAQSGAARAAGLQPEERVGAVPALPDLLPGRDVIASFLHQPGTSDRRSAVREADAHAAVRARDLGGPPAEETPPLRRAVGRGRVAVGEPQPRARRGVAPGRFHAYGVAPAVVEWQEDLVPGFRGWYGSEACAVAVRLAPRPAAGPPAKSKPAIRRILIRSLFVDVRAVHPLSALALQPH